MSTPTDLPLDELHALRERAYGPTADIHADPAAMARLAQLEAQARAAASPGVVEQETDAGPLADADDPAQEMPAASPPTASPLASSPPVDGEHPEEPGAAGAPSEEDAAGAEDDTWDPADGPPSATTAPAPWWRRRMPLLWAGSVVAALILGAGLTLGIESFESGKVAVLSVDPGADWPADMWGDPEAADPVGFEVFYGLSVTSLNQQWTPSSPTMSCLSVFSGVDDNLSYYGGSCGAGRFPPTAVFYVTADAPKELRDRFPEGTALQFVLEDERVHVYAEEPSVIQPTP